MLEEIFAVAFVPLFNKVLTELLERRLRRQTVSMNEEDLYGELPNADAYKDDEEAMVDAVDD